MVQEVDLHTFLSNTNDWQWVSHTQMQGWIDAFLRGSDVRCFMSENIACVGWVTRKWGKRMLTVKGECFRSLPVSNKQVFAFFEHISKIDVDLVSINSDSVYSADYEVGIRQAGFLRPVGMFSTTLSKVVSLDQPYVFDRSWQRNLKQADDSRLSFVPAVCSEQAADEYVRLHNEMERRKGFNDGLTVEQLRVLLTQTCFRMAWVDDNSGNHLAGGIVYQRGGYGRFLYSFTTPMGREKSASYLLYKGWMDNLSLEGVTRFDLGRLSPSKHLKNNLFLFKNGIGGEVVSYNGEWAYSSSVWLPFAIYVANKYYWKRVRV
ncbi:MAG: hypothetical protein K5660_04025 [Paludibacteraceae bacterium]|nr:hypothetical protein [Paludibacteraceae bacterium]